MEVARPSRSLCLMMREAWEVELGIYIKRTMECIDGGR